MQAVTKLLKLTPASAILVSEDDGGNVVSESEVPAALLQCDDLVKVCRQNLEPKFEKPTLGFKILRSRMFRKFLLYFGRPRYDDSTPDFVQICFKVRNHCSVDKRSGDNPSRCCRFFQGREFQWMALYTEVLVTWMNQ